MKKVALVGSCPSSRLLAPYDDPEWEIWACSVDNVGKLPRVDHWFEIHGDILCTENTEWSLPYIDWLNSQSFTVWAQDKELFKNGIHFPAEELIEEFGAYFFTSTPAWMFAFAIKQKPSVIGIYGMDMTVKLEYRAQRPAMHHFMHLAFERGIVLDVPDESDLMQSPPLYGYSDVTPFGRKAVVWELELQARIAKLEQQERTLKHERTVLLGALSGCDYMKTVWTGRRGQFGRIEQVSKAAIDLKVVGS